jgi:uncharacterized membrane protein YphA (DoxX/SURF4 family)
MSTLAATSPAPSKVLNGSLWTVQVLLGLMFLMAGFTKLTTPLDQLLAMMPWVSAVPGALVRFIGISELAGGLGLVLPAATRIKPVLTPIAAGGLVVVMILAALLHASRGEFGALPVNFVLGGLAAFVAWGRATRARIAPRA